MDIVLREVAAIEVMSAETIVDKQLKGLRALKEEGIFSKYYIVCMEQVIRETNVGISELPWKEFLQRL